MTGVKKNRKIVSRAHERHKKLFKQLIKKDLVSQFHATIFLSLFIDQYRSFYIVYIGSINCLSSV